MAHRIHRVNFQFSSVGTLVLPGDKPDIEFLMRVTSKPRVEKCILYNKQMLLNGYIDIFIEYVAAVSDGTQPIVSIFSQMPFDKALPTHHTRTGLHVSLKCTIHQQHLQIKSPREIEATINVSIPKIKLLSLHQAPTYHCQPNVVNLLEVDNQRVFLPSHPEVTFNQLNEKEYSQTMSPSLPT